MAGCLYYIPRFDRQIPFEEIRKAGLAYALDEKATACTVSNGPGGGGSGVVLAVGLFSGHRIGYFEAKQTWRRIPKSAAWVGFYTDAPPVPDDLVRDQPLPGGIVTLGDGNEWSVPIARANSVTDGQLSSAIALPSRVTIDDDGAWRNDGIVPRYAELWAAADGFWAAFVVPMAETDDQPELDGTVAYDWALSALQANYRVGKAEVAMLGLFDDVNVARILRILIDWDTIVQWQKKNDADDASDGTRTVDKGA